MNQPDHNTIDELERAAEASGAAADWMRLADTLADKGQPGDALALLRQVWGIAREAMETDPQAAIEYGEFLLTAAPIAADAELVTYAEYLMRALSRDAPNMEMKRAAEERLAIVAQRRHQFDDDSRLHELQLASVTEGIAAGRSGPEHYLQLAELRLVIGEQDEMGSRLPAALAAVDAGLLQNPRTAALLEARVRLLSHLGSQQPLDDALRLLERFHPGSSLLEEFAEGREPDDPGALDDGSLGLVFFLDHAAKSPDAAEVEAAVADLQAMTDARPRRRLLHVFLARALLSAGRHQEARQRISVLARTALPDFHDHFNLAQLYHQSADRAQAQQHALLARDHAAGDELAEAEALLIELQQVT